jgi:hypothetical protein
MSRSRDGELELNAKESALMMALWKLRRDFEMKIVPLGEVLFDSINNEQCQ